MFIKQPELNEAAQFRQGMDFQFAIVATTPSCLHEAVAENHCYTCAIFPTLDPFQAFKLKPVPPKFEICHLWYNVSLGEGTSVSIVRNFSEEGFFGTQTYLEPSREFDCEPLLTVLSTKLCGFNQQTQGPCMNYFLCDGNYVILE